MEEEEKEEEEEEEEEEGVGYVDEKSRVGVTKEKAAGVEEEEEEEEDGTLDVICEGGEDKDGVVGT